MPLPQPLQSPDLTAFRHTPMGQRAARLWRWLKDHHGAVLATTLVLAIGGLAAANKASHVTLSAPLTPPFAHQDGFAWASAPLVNWPPARSGSFYLLEDGRRRGLFLSAQDPNSAAIIRAEGGGVFTREGERFLFSTADDTDPNLNGRRYAIEFAFRQAGFRLMGPAAGVAILAALLFCAWCRGRVRSIAIALVLAAAGLASTQFSYVAFVALALTGLTAGIYLAVEMAGYLLPMRWQGRADAAAANLTLLAASVSACLIAAEILLWALSPPAVHANGGRGQARLLPLLIGEARAETIAVNTPSRADADALIDPATLELAKRRVAAVVMPTEWEQREARVPGAYAARYWQGALHVYNTSRMRRIGRPPPKDPSVFRILVVGDSLTYGDGIDATYTYASQLGRLLGREWRVEIVNAGVDGAQSEDVVNIARSMLPQTNPDLVIYGVCLNDFLPSGVGEYDGSIRLPEVIRKRTRIGPAAQEMISKALIRLGVTRDFFDDILYGIAAYRQRFARDVAALNRLVLDRGLPPAIAMVVDQYPSEGGRGQRLAQIAEQALDAGDLTVVATGDYYRRFGHGPPMMVSRWEGHPNEEAHAIWALMLAQAVAKDPRLSHYARGQAKSEPR